MRKILLIFLMLAGYFWLVTSGQDGVVLEKGKALYEAAIHWFDDAELDFQWNQQDKSPKKSRRWD